LRNEADRVGLDIGSAMIKAVSIERRKGDLTLAYAAVAATPVGVLTEGEFTDGITVSKALRGLWKDYGISTKRVAAAVSGEHVHCRSELTDGPADEIGAILRQRAAQVSQLQPDDLAVGFQSIRDMVEGASLWTACPVRQVEWMCETLSLAGRTATAVEPQACALANAYSYNYQPAKDDAALLLHVGARRMAVVVTRGWAVAWSGEIALSNSWGADPAAARKKVREIVEENWSEWRDYARPVGLERVFVSGGSARGGELVSELGGQIGLEVEELDPFRRIRFREDSTAHKVAREHGSTLAVAAGLSLSAFEVS